MGGTQRGRILTFNCHEGYIHLLGKLGLELDVVDGLSGRYTQQWDTRMRPVPPCARLIRPEDLAARAAETPYRAVIAHNVHDLVEARDVVAPKILVLHVNLAARVLEEPGSPPPREVTRQLATYLEFIGAVTVAVLETKRRSWNLAARVIRPAVDPSEWSGYTGEKSMLLRVANQVTARKRRFGWSDHERIVEGLGCRLVGHNPDIPGSRSSKNWDDLKQSYRVHRAYLHTAGEGLDDGYNLALLEAMATGMPVLSTVRDESPILDGENGYLSRDLGRLHDDAARLLADVELARRLGARARETALDSFGLEPFVAGWHRAIEDANDVFSRQGARAAS